MNRWITLFAVAGKGGVLGASGLGVLAAADVCWNRSSAASQPRPRPEFWRNFRREWSIDWSIDIDKLTHVQHQQAKPRKGIPLQVVERRLSLRGAGGAPECQPPPDVYCSFRIGF